MKKKTLLILLAAYLALNAVIVAIGLALPPWQPSSAAESEEVEISDLSELSQRQTSAAGLATLDAKVASGTAQPSIEELPEFDETSSAYPELVESNRMNMPEDKTPSASHINWGGFWFVYLEQADGTYLSGELTLTVAEADLAGSGTIGDAPYEFEGTIIDNGEGVQGTWTSPSGSGTFAWTALAEAEFAGSRDASLGFCGARPGLPQPAPCYRSP